MTIGTEYPKWIRHPGEDDVLVDNAAAEAEQMAAWTAIAPKPKANPLLSPVRDSVSDNDLPALRIAYKEKTGKRAFPGWDADELRARMAAAA